MPENVSLAADQLTVIVFSEEAQCILEQALDAGLSPAVANGLAKNMYYTVAWYCLADEVYRGASQGQKDGIFLHHVFAGQCAYLTHICGSVVSDWRYSRMYAWALWLLAKIERKGKALFSIAPLSLNFCLCLSSKFMSLRRALCRKSLLCMLA